MTQALAPECRDENWNPAGVNDGHLSFACLRQPAIQADAQDVFKLSDCSCPDRVGLCPLPLYLSFLLSFLSLVEAGVSRRQASGETPCPACAHPGRCKEGGGRRESGARESGSPETVVPALQPLLLRGLTHA
eukprot:scaffold151204_cov31-Tisochrysis_lutea.AAC.1